MSTKDTLAYGNNFDIYQECFDESQAVYLEINTNNSHFVATPKISL